MLLVNQLPLPAELVAQMDSGRWQSPPDGAALARLFPEGGEFCAYTLAQMESETAGLREASLLPLVAGMADQRHPPGNIDLTKAVCIADLGMGSDQPIALDYRLSPDAPRVLVLRWISGDLTAPYRDRYRWVEAAPTFAAFAELLGL